jgi:hypothetical protein
MWPHLTPQARPASFSRVRVQAARLVDEDAAPDSPRKAAAVKRQPDPAEPICLQSSETKLRPADMSKKRSKDSKNPKIKMKAD